MSAELAFKWISTTCADFRNVGVVLAARVDKRDLIVEFSEHEGTHDLRSLTGVSALANPQGFEGAADRGGADPVAEPKEHALDALVSPAVVLGGEPLNEGSDLGADRQASRVVRVGPLLSAPATMPSPNGAGVTSRCARSRLGRCRVRRPMPPGRPSPAGAGLLQCITATSCRSTSSSVFLDAGDRRSRDQPAAKSAEDQVEQAN